MKDIDNDSTFFVNFFEARFAEVILTLAAPSSRHFVFTLDAEPSDLLRSLERWQKRCVLHPVQYATRQCLYCSSTSVD